MPFHIDNRPKTLNEVIGNEGVKESIKAVFEQEDRPHTSLFIGPSGCGKTTLARIVARMIGCSPDDIQEYNSSNTRGIDTIREIAQNSMYAPMSGKVKVYLLDEVHRMTKDAQNALLKLLEDTPKHVYFLLCTTDPEMLIKAIRTRCMTFEVKNLAAPQITALIEKTLKDCGELENFSKKVIKTIVKVADGCPRQAMILLDQVFNILDEDAAIEALNSATATAEVASIELCRILLDSRTNRWADVRYILKSIQDEPEKLRYGILGYLDAVLMSDNCKDPARVCSLMDCFRESYMYSGKAALHSDCYNASLI